jgi:hypothetical protein
VLGQLDNATHPSRQSGQGGPHRKNELHCDVWSVGGERRQRAASGVVVDSSRCGEAVLSDVVLEVWLNRSKRGWSGLSTVARLEWGGAVVRGRRGCWGWSWKGRKGTPARGGARGGDGRARWWPEEAVLGETGCSGQHQHEVRRKQRWGVSARRRSKRGSSSVGRSPYSRTRRWPRAVEPLGGEVVGVGKWRWPLFEGGWHGLAQLAHGSYWETDTRGSHGFFIILELSKPAQL